MPPRRKAACTSLAGTAPPALSTNLLHASPSAPDHASDIRRRERSLVQQRFCNFSLASGVGWRQRIAAFQMVFEHEAREQGAARVVPEARGLLRHHDCGGDAVERARRLARERIVLLR